MNIGTAFRRLTRAFKAAGTSYRESRSSAREAAEAETAGRPHYDSNSIDWETSVNDEVVICEANHPGARLIAVASLYGRVQIRVCQKNMSEAEFRAAFPVAYTYGPGGSERAGKDIGISFTTGADLLARLREDSEWEPRRNPYLKRLPRLRMAETTFVWAIVNSNARHFQYSASNK